jgi:two-component system sensor histidine kinase KdpD
MITQTWSATETSLSGLMIGSIRLGAARVRDLFKKDREVILDRPDVHERAAVPNVPTRGKPLAAPISLTDSAKKTPGFVGADLEKLALQATFFSATAHELKTPLTVLKTLAPTLCPLPHLPDQTQNEIAETFAQNLERLELLVTDMLESARLEAGMVALHPRSLDLASRTRRVLERLTPLLERKQQNFELQVPDHLPPVQADGKRVEQLLSNLIDNAAKFAPPASVIEVSLSQHSSPDGRGLVQVVVADAGPGVPPLERELIFDRFYSATDGAMTGVGLGLFICRELVRLHGGRIWVEDRPGGGSRFCFTLPLTCEEATDEENQPQISDLAGPAEAGLPGGFLAPARQPKYHKNN